MFLRGYYINVIYLDLRKDFNEEVSVRVKKRDTALNMIFMRDCNFCWFISSQYCQVIFATNDVDYRPGVKLQTGQSAVAATGSSRVRVDCH